VEEEAEPGTVEGRLFSKRSEGFLQDPGGGDGQPFRQREFRNSGPAGLGDGRRDFADGQDLVPRQVIDLPGPPFFRGEPEPPNEVVDINGRLAPAVGGDEGEFPPIDGLDELEGPPVPGTVGPSGPDDDEVHPFCREAERGPFRLELRPVIGIPRIRRIILGGHKAFLDRPDDPGGTDMDDLPDTRVLGRPEEGFGPADINLEEPVFREA